MDPITAAILAALAGGAAKSATKVGESLLADAYAGLKAILRQKFGVNGPVEVAVRGVEERPESPGRGAVLQEELVATNAASDPEIRKAADAVMAELKKQPGGEQIIQQVFNSSYVAQAAGGGDATVTVGSPARPADET
jgi:hypothetical protein